MGDVEGMGEDWLDEVGECGVLTMEIVTGG